MGLVYYFSKVKDGLYSSKYVFVYLLLCSTLGSITVPDPVDLNRPCPNNLLSTVQYPHYRRVPVEYSTVAIVSDSNRRVLRASQSARVEAILNTSVTPHRLRAPPATTRSATFCSANVSVCACGHRCNRCRRFYASRPSRSCCS